MIAIYFLLALQGSNVSSATKQGCEAGITISATITTSMTMAMNTEDLGIVGVDAYRVAITYSTGGVANAVIRSEEYFIMRRPGSTDETQIIASLDLSGSFVFEGTSTEIIAMHWDDAKPIIAALHKGRFLIAWRGAKKLNRA